MPRLQGRHGARGAPIGAGFDNGSWPGTVSGTWVYIWQHDNICQCLDHLMDQLALAIQGVPHFSQNMLENHYSCSSILRQVSPEPNHIIYWDYNGLKASFGYSHALGGCTLFRLAHAVLKMGHRPTMEPNHICNWDYIRLKACSVWSHATLIT